GETRTERVAFTPSEQAYVADFCGLDKRWEDHPETGETVLTCQVVALADCELHGHTGSIVHVPSGAVVNPVDKPANWNQVRGRVLSRRPPIDGQCLSLVTFARGHKQYFHFLAEYLLWVCHYMVHHHQPGTPITILTRPDLAPFQESALAFLRQRYPEMRHETLGETEKVATPGLVWLFRKGRNPYHSFVDQQAIALLRALYIDGYGLAKAAPEKPLLLYASRADAKLRNFTNDAAVRALLDQRGFETHVVGNLDHPTQARLFHAAAVVVCAHGAALTSQIFCRPGTHVIEISAADFVQSTYLWMAKQLSLNHHPVIGGKGDSQQNFEVDIPALTAVLDSLDIKETAP
ncbi:MAG: glycosyltransferase family 61 protein, partial [Magnetospiraceae bacterium]